ncbi:FecR domain-containing protein [Reichenbachiella sp. MALMAid0571]|uniref:FecR family protein n=1 Tax=Reichenbachiella sp. MALMAid0571 TaxID=3143939 RepID=UPI0032DF729F
MEKQKYNKYKTSDFILDEDFQNWVKGSDPKNEKKWSIWLDSNPALQPKVEKARQILLALNFKEEIIDSKTLDDEWQKLRNSKDDRSLSLQTIKNKPKTINWSVRIAAAIAFIVISSLVVLKFTMHGSNRKEVTMVHKKAALGQKITLTLADGTNIKLNAGSHISYPDKFSSDKREVILTGEAFFKVTPNADAPFIVRTGNISTTVLGTSFNINAYPEKDQVQVAVVEGKVKVNTHDPKKNIDAEVYLTHDELASVPKNESEILVTPFEASELLAWKDGILHFGRSDFKEVVKHLERWYGVKFTIRKNKKIDPEWRFSGKFENKSLEYILDVFSYPERFSFRIDGSKVTIN